MSVIRIPVRRIEAQAWEGYKIKTDLGDGRPGKRMPGTVSWLEPTAADRFKEMQDACGYRMQFTDIYRSVRHQARARAGARGSKKHRMLAPPTKSGHNFCFSFDVAMKETLLAFRRSGFAELITAGQNRRTLAVWMIQFGFSGITKESWHYNFLGDYRSTVSKINERYEDSFKIGNKDVQRCLNVLLKPDTGLVVDGILGKKSHKAAIASMGLLDVTRNDAGAFNAWFRRVLAGATAVLVDVDA